MRFIDRMFERILKAPTRVRNRGRRFYENVWQYNLLKIRVRHLHGPANPAIPENGVILLCKIRNGSEYIESFVDHYVDLGVSHFVFLDNGSTDNTVECVKRLKNTTVLQANVRCELHLLHKYLIDRFGWNRWSLRVDIDEFFDFPFSEKLSLGGLIEYLNLHGYTAVVTYMLDLFPKKLIRDSSAQFEIGDHCFYELAHVTKHPYPSYHNCSFDPEISYYLRGGIRARMFGLDNVCLTKHALVFRSKSTDVFDDHFVTGANVADFTGVLRHYKFSDGFFDNIDDSVQRGVHWKNAFEYREYQNATMGKSNLEFLSDDSFPYKGTDELINQGFLFVSPRFVEYAKKCPP